MSSIPAEAKELLTSEPLIAHLATCTEGAPHVAPLWFAVHDDHVEIVTTGRKLANLRRNPRVAISVQKDEGGADPQWGVTLQGTATVVDDEAESAAIRRRVHGRYGADADIWPENVSVRIDVGNVDHWRY